MKLDLVSGCFADIPRHLHRGVLKLLIKKDVKKLH